ncbi:hypothetical protein PENSOL_c010G00726 [Penicillium solitum]|uniref:Uncharacterized protein n=1 Tax=Penicillium solitum TaxID=60172 RepID=A0A1V6RAE9_9EURO|nr:uncharacterized protein PENSOL_c010G00726 [Penicillium solitum]OQD98172.1 hypothetical protein PENSOL_c010G00726 [Penicillium solitum]
MIRRSDDLKTCSPLARLGEADRISNTTIPSMHIDRPPSTCCSCRRRIILSMRMDRPPTILMMTYQATGVLKYDAADPFNDRSNFSDAFSEAGGSNHPSREHSEERRGRRLLRASSIVRDPWAAGRHARPGI